MSRIACIGDNCVDFYDASEEAFFGGNPLNAAVYFCRQGGEAAYIGAVGNDEFGERLKNAAASKNVDVSHVQVKEGRTALTHVALENGERILGDYEEGVMKDFSMRCWRERTFPGVWKAVRVPAVLRSRRKEPGRAVLKAFKTRRCQRHQPVGINIGLFDPVGGCRTW